MLNLFKNVINGFSNYLGGNNYKSFGNISSVNSYENHENNVVNFDDCIISSDKTKLQCAITNLIFNAIEACSYSCEVCVDCFVEPKEVRILVKNNGEKIPQDIQNKIFQSDFTTKEKGNGLGLAICRQQIQMLGGNINLVHSNDVETLFEIVLSV